ncbi:MAG: 3,4-dehydroadipyl-CoA semialdehyde dehydrogenase [Deltaproteobacteria bacterium]|nr:3,4-dehydroadipyl-CoA semialdehyde dehydrogenase [Deltaproteobacteria bacterium]
MITLKSYLNGKWQAGEGEGNLMLNPTTEETLASASTRGLDLKSALAFGREKGGATLREMSFVERGALLKKMSQVFHEKREELIQISLDNGGTTRKGAKFDIDGAIGTLAYYASLGIKLGEKTLLTDGEPEALMRAPRFVGLHIRAPRRGIAVHINAFNFPMWGMYEKAACALLAGMPVMSKPGTSTALLAFRSVEMLVEQDLLPAGTFQMLCGSAGDLLDHLEEQDVLAFTGGASTGAMMRGHRNIIANNVRVNIEADSLNAVVLGDASDETYSTFLRHIETEVTQKTGQKCTATRRIFVPADRIDEVEAELKEIYGSLKVGAPDAEGVHMGPLATSNQLRDANEGLEKLKEAGAKLVFGEGSDVTPLAAEKGKGFFFGPVLLRADQPREADAVHDVEVFGPVQTLMPYDSIDEAIALVARGKGGLVCSVYTDDKKETAALLTGLSPFHGRVLLTSEKVAETGISPGMALPSCLHGGPGRAGGGEELGGERGMHFYMQRTAIQGDRSVLERHYGLRD